MTTAITVDKKRDNNRDERGRFLPGNEHRIKPGQVTNPRGRPPKEVCLTSLLKDALDQIPEGAADGKTWAERIVLALLNGAVSTRPSSATLMKELLDRVEGTVVTKFKGELKAYRTVEE